MDDSEFRSLIAPKHSGGFAAEEAATGIPIPAVKRVELFSATEWEEFVEEWAHALEPSYDKVQRYAGAGDKGCDVVGFCSAARFTGEWDNYQCKHYAGSLRPSDVWLEIGKIIHYSFIGEYAPPRKYYFVAPKGIGLTLKKLLNDPDKLRSGLVKAWSRKCQSQITLTKEIPLEGDFLSYVEDFDYRNFDSKSLADLIKEHNTTPFYATRFGGGLRPRPPVDPVPKEIGPQESRYVQQLMEAYSDHLDRPISHPSHLNSWPSLSVHFGRSRETFFHAESLRNSARDTVPQGTFEDLQDEVYFGVANTCDAPHPDGLARVNATVDKATQVPLTSNALCKKVKIQDRQGICHQLANDDHLIWVKKDD